MNSIEKIFIRHVSYEHYFIKLWKDSFLKDERGLCVATQFSLRGMFGYVKFMFFTNKLSHCNILDLKRASLAMGSQHWCIFEQLCHVNFCTFLQCIKRLTLNVCIFLVLLHDFTNNSLEWTARNQQMGRSLQVFDFLNWRSTFRFWIFPDTTLKIVKPIIRFLCDAEIILSRRVIEIYLISSHCSLQVIMLKTQNNPKILTNFLSLPDEVEDTRWSEPSVLELAPLPVSLPLLLLRAELRVERRLCGKSGDSYALSRLAVDWDASETPPPFEVVSLADIASSNPFLQIATFLPVLLKLK